MPYTPYGWQDAPDGWDIGDPIPEGYEYSEINATNLEAFGAHVLTQAVAVVQYDDGWAPRPTGAALVIWNGGDVSTPPTVGGESGALDGVDWWVPVTGEGA